MQVTLHGQVCSREAGKGREKGLNAARVLTGPEAGDRGNMFKDYCSS